MKVLKLGLPAWLAFMAAIAAAGVASAQTCTAYPNTLTNGSTADATQVMANFNCAALLGGATFTGGVNVGTTGTGATLTATSTSIYNDALVAIGPTGAASGLRVGSSATNLELIANSSAGAYNPIVQSGDSTVIAKGATIGTGGLVLAPWSSSAGGIRINSSGYVGIGTTSPITNLDITGGANISSSLLINNGISANTPGSLSPLYIAGTVIAPILSDEFTGSSGTANTTVNAVFRAARGTPAAPAALQAGDYIGGFGGKGYNGSAYSSNRGGVVVVATENWTTSANGDAIVFRATPNTTTTTSEVMRIDNTGYVGIGTTAPSYPLYVNGTAYASGAAGALSDIRHKDKIKELPDGAVALVDKLRPVTFVWKKPTDDGMKGEQIGFIAQDVEKVLPSVVLTEDNAEKTKGLKYTELIPVLTKAIQEQQAEIKALEAEVAAQKTQIDALSGLKAKAPTAAHRRKSR